MAAVTSADMYGDLRPTGTGGTAEHRLKQLCRTPLLLLDDLGSAKASEWTEEITYRLINHRYNHCLPTIFTSNLPARADGGLDLTDALGRRIVSRLAEMATLVPMTGSDRRRTRQTASEPTPLPATMHAPPHTNAVADAQPPAVQR
jgi:DNA replication protein DnaC